MRVIGFSVASASALGVRRLWRRGLVAADDDTHSSRDACSSPDAHSRANSDTHSDAAAPITGISQSADIATFTNPFALKPCRMDAFLLRRGATQRVHHCHRRRNKDDCRERARQHWSALRGTFAKFRDITDHRFSYAARDTSAPRVGRAKDDPSNSP
jgi:hypothetical protein